MKAWEILSSPDKWTKDGLFQYKEKWSDEEVARVMPFNCSPGNVAGVRKTLFGKIKIMTRGSLEDRITAIEEYLTRKDKDWRLA